jgi:hypothetical protein
MSESESIYGIASRYANLLSVLSDDSIDNAEFGNTIQDALQATEGELAIKCANGIGFLRFLDDKIAAVEAQEKRIKDYKAFLKGRQDVVKNAFMNGLKLAEKQEIITDNGVMKIRKNPPKVVIHCADMVPEEYLRKTITFTPDKTALKTALQAGKAIPGAHLEQGENLKY